MQSIVWDKMNHLPLAVADKNKKKKIIWSARRRVQSPFIPNLHQSSHKFVNELEYSVNSYGAYDSLTFTATDVICSLILP